MLIKQKAKCRAVYAYVLKLTLNDYEADANIDSKNRKKYVKD